MVEHLSADSLNHPNFDVEVYTKVAQAKTDLLMKANIEGALQLLSSTEISSFILEMTGIERTIRNVAYELRPTIRPICAYILRKWDRQKRDPIGIKPRLFITPSRPEKKLEVEFDSSDFIFHTMKQQKKIHWNKTGGVRSLKDICRKEIQAHIHVTVKKKKITSLFVLIKNTTKERLELMEEKLTVSFIVYNHLAVAEISDMLWEAMLYYHFRGQVVPLAMTNKESFDYLWMRRKEFDQELSKVRAVKTFDGISKPSIIIRKLFSRLVFYLAEIFT